MDSQTRLALAENFLDGMKQTILEDLAKAPDNWDGLEVRAYCSRAFMAQHPATVASWSVSRRVAFRNDCAVLPMRY